MAIKTATAARPAVKSTAKATSKAVKNSVSTSSSKSNANKAVEAALASVQKAAKAIASATKSMATQSTKRDTFTKTGTVQKAGIYSVPIPSKSKAISAAGGAFAIAEALKQSGAILLSQARTTSSAKSSSAQSSNQNVSNKSSRSYTCVFTAKEGMKNTGEKDQIAGLPIDFSKTTYMSYSKVTNDNSWQAGIRDDSFDNGGYTYVDKNGLYRSTITPGKKSKDDYYIVAMGYGFVNEAQKYDSEYDESVALKMKKYNNDKILNFTSEGKINAGYTYKVELTDSTGANYAIDVLIGSTKGDSNSYVPHDNVIEFIVDGVPKGSVVGKNGNVDYQLLVGANHKTSISKISIYSDSARYTGTEFEGKWTHRK